jgi:hypothetical protein
MKDTTSRHIRRVRSIQAAVALLIGAAPAVFANGGPFIVKYPGGDPAAKGVLARLDPSLKPAREERLRVLQENLTIAFGNGTDFRFTGEGQPPLATVTAEYHIQNPTEATVEMDFGFPILRGIYMNPLAMMPVPDAWVTVDGKRQESSLISNSAIYGLVRRRARQLVDERIAADPPLQTRVQAIRSATGDARSAAKTALARDAVSRLGWNERDAALLTEYAAVDLGTPRVLPPGAGDFFWGRNAELYALATENLGVLSAIGEQKATQFLAQLAVRFNPEAAAGYEDIFKSWGGEVTERSIDLSEGRIRPREIVVPPNSLTGWAGRVRLAADPTLYARVDYLDERSNLKEDEKALCKSVLKNLPVVFTFAPMNLLHYRVTFPPKSEQTVTVTYRQYAYEDTKQPASYQLAYVVHPASLWKEFGPIHLKIVAPEAVRVVCSIPCAKSGNIYETTLIEKTGELFVGLDKAGWNEHRTALIAPKANRSSKSP